jgi:hypothetical protein
VQDQRDTIDKLEGLPRHPTFVGSAIRHLVPAAWDGTGNTPLGWTKHLCSLTESEDGAAATLDVPNDVAGRQQGKSATVNGRTVTVDLRAAADVPDPPRGGR